jgi:hypothetical protein
MKIKTSELEGAALDYAVAIIDPASEEVARYSPSTDWSQGGPLLSEYATHAEKYPLAKHEPWVVWVANDEPGQCGDTLLIAAMRAIVVAELGDTVDVPEELLK